MASQPPQPPKSTLPHLVEVASGPHARKLTSCSSVLVLRLSSSSSLPWACACRSRASRSRHKGRVPVAGLSSFHVASHPQPWLLPQSHTG